MGGREGDICGGRVEGAGEGACAVVIATRDNKMASVSAMLTQAL